MAETSRRLRVTQIKSGLSERIASTGLPALADAVGRDAAAIAAGRF